MRRENHHGFHRVCRQLTWVLGLCVCLAALPTMAQTVSVGYQKQLTIPIANAIAAYSLNSRCAEASANEETVTIVGTGPCDTRVVVITDKGSQALEVHVIPPPPGYPPGFIPPDRSATSGEVSNYEIRYLSDPGQVENTFDSIERQGNRLTQLHLSSLAYISPGETQSRISLPFLFYAVTTPHVRVTFFDQAVTNSPLTVDGSVIRGFHLSVGRWLFHAGYTSTAAFENILLPLRKEGVLGLGYRLPVGSFGSLTANVYSIQANAATDSAAKSGQIESLAYAYKPSEHLKLMAEVGFSHGLGFAGQVESTRVGDHLKADLRYEPGNFASLGLNNFHGLFANLNWDHQISTRWSARLGLVDDQYIYPGFRQKNLNSSLSLDYRLTRRWTLFGGGGYSSFDSGTSLFPKVSGVNFQDGVSFDTSHFGSSFQYQYSRNGGSNPGGQGFSGSVHGGGRHLYASSYFNRQTQTPSLSYIFEQIPGLQQALAGLDIQATSPEELIQLIQSDVALQNLGVLSGLSVHLSPLNMQLGGDLTWSPGQNDRQKFRLSVVDDRVEMLQSTTRTTFATLSFTRKLSYNTELSASFTMFRTSAGNSSAQLQPLGEISLRHRFNGGPRLLMSMPHGSIGGTVFLDEAGAGVPGPNTKPMEGIKVVLDGTRRATSDRSGHYAFTRVPNGSHTVEVIFKSDKPVFFTTASRVEADINTEVNFGVTYSSSRIFGFVRNDAGAGVPGVHVMGASAKRHFQAETGSEGKFSIGGMEEGVYQVSVDANTLPPGYVADQLAPEQVEATAGAPAKVDLTVRAARSISGKIITFDRTTGQLVAVGAVRVRLLEQKAESVTDANGVFLFRNLPAGAFTVVVEYDGKEYSRSVQLPSEPMSLRNVDINVIKQEPQKDLQVSGDGRDLRKQ